MNPYITGQETDDRTRITRIRTDFVSVKIRLIRVIRVLFFKLYLRLSIEYYNGVACRNNSQISPQRAQRSQRFCCYALRSLRPLRCKSAQIFITHKILNRQRQYVPCACTISRSLPLFSFFPSSSQ